MQVRSFTSPVRFLASFLLLLPILWAQTFNAIDVSEATTRPIPIKTTEPEYTEDARTHRVEATVLLGLVIAADGSVARVRVLRPAGFGLDEQAVRTVSGWRFEPGTKDGAPVAVRVNAQLSFRLLDRAPEGKEKRELDDALAELGRAKSPDDLTTADAVRKIRALADAGVPEAQFALAKYLDEGSAEARKLLESAAEGGYVPAMAKLGDMYVGGVGAERDYRKGIELLSRAARLGSMDARRTLAMRLESTDPARALEYFRGCGSQGDGSCQLHAGSMLMSSSDAEDRIEAAAWLVLASRSRVADADGIRERFTSSFSEKEKALAEKLAESLAKQP
jgi:TonB family protein